MPVRSYEAVWSFELVSKRFRQHFRSGRGYESRGTTCRKGTRHLVHYLKLIFETAFCFGSR